jgi:hypothetical protein
MSLIAAYRFVREFIFNSLDLLTAEFRVLSFNKDIVFSDQRLFDSIGQRQFAPLTKRITDTPGPEVLEG